MTVIAAFTPYNFNILFGDLMLSVDGEGLQPPDLTLPAARDGLFNAAGTGYSIFSLRQKVVVIKNVAIAWSGVFAGAKKVIGELVRHAEGEETVDPAFLDRFFNEVIEALLAATAQELRIEECKTQFIAIASAHPRPLPSVAHPNFGVGVIYRYRSPLTVRHIENNPLLEEVTISGSGSDVVLRLLEQATDDHLNDLEQEEDPGSFGHAFALLIFGALLNEEFRRGRNYKKLFGGGYECAYWYGPNEMRKSPPMTFFFWRVSGTARAFELIGPDLLIKQQYWDNVLLLKSARTVPTNEGASTLVVQPLNTILPPHLDASDVNFDELPTVEQIGFRSQRFIHCISIEFPDPEVPSVVVAFPDDFGGPRSTALISEAAGVITVQATEFFKQELHDRFNRNAIARG